MSQEYFSDKGKAPAKGRPAQSETTSNDDAKAPKPTYMTVGTGSTSEHAARLQAMIESDSGYGGSLAGDDAAAGIMAPGSPAWDLATQADIHDPEAQGHARRQQSGAIHQLWYNSQRSTLNRSISRVIELLQELQKTNASWPAHYPTVQSADTTSNSRPSSRPGFQHTNSMISDNHPTAPPKALRRSMTSFEDNARAESSRSAEGRSTPEPPRLVTPQIAQEFSILKLDLKLGAVHQAELVHSLEKTSIASLLDGKISSSIKHLLNLRERIDDTSSKVLITGDLNAGKSTFCNALLRRKVLPEDQQPCTSIFCEVLDSRENSGIEEVHAVHKDAVYDRNDEATYDVFSLAELEKIVTDNKTYMQCKIYIKDVRTIDESLLNNGVVDIALIDAPGLNSDTTKTTAIFARQEEIDVVVFVVSAANHFTQSAKEFIFAAAAEKAYLFIVVNGFDNIRDQDRCKEKILEQVYGLSRDTFKESDELVHFVASNRIPMAPSPPGGSNGGGSGSSSGGGGGGGGDDPSGDPKGKGKDKENQQDFDVLEQSLRRFVLEKRARSKLAPAKNYLTNILNDLHSLATVNTEVANSEVERVRKELDEIEPQLATNKRAKYEVDNEIEKTIEATCKDVYDHSRATISFSITHASSAPLGVPYPGLFSIFSYADDIKAAMLDHIAASVTECEEVARTKSISGVAAIANLGILHLGDKFENHIFMPDNMFAGGKALAARQVDIPTELWDFVDWSALLERQEKVASTGVALTLATAVVPQVVGGHNWVSHAMSAARLVGNNNVRRLVPVAAVTVIIAAGAYMVSQIPNSLPRRLSKKIEARLVEQDYVHKNAFRVASRVRKAMNHPANKVREGLNLSVEQLGTRREDTLRVRAESEVALKYFGNLVRKSAKEKAAIEAVDLDSQPSAAAH